MAKRAAAKSPPNPLVVLIALPLNVIGWALAAGGTLVAPATPDTVWLVLDGNEVE